MISKNLYTEVSRYHDIIESYLCEVGHDDRTPPYFWIVLKSWCNHLRNSQIINICCDVARQLSICMLVNSGCYYPIPSKRQNLNCDVFSEGYKRICRPFHTIIVYSDTHTCEQFLNLCWFRFSLFWCFCLALCGISWGHACVPWFCWVLFLQY